MAYIGVGVEGGPHDGSHILVVKPGEVVSLQWLAENCPSDSVVIAFSLAA